MSPASEQGSRLLIARFEAAQGGNLLDPLEIVLPVHTNAWQVDEFVGDAATFPGMLALNDIDLAIRPGMIGRAEIQREE